MGHRLAPLFAFDHLPPHLQTVSKPFAAHATTLMDSPLRHEHPETIDAALWKLWEAKNLVVMAAAQATAP